ncbi:hypothetical protein KIH86_09105 [Paenibacillus sp. HN-1]|uniref:stalk domain-containing protein n=1 Tax=Paenibacillus TaxID=44249 RepID=UPI001CA9265B|nr:MULTISPECIES: stalk domain-containing protein [Paenibacillus]MBY9079743.1 hypothetical protein [Paenibacillus sp. CGMCC 1.18879]MBY9084387.1 hypothetical protein [Paenibacillus sinensis]
MKRRTKSALLAACISILLGSGVPSGKASAAPKKYPVLLKINDYYVLYTAPKAPYVDGQGRIMIPLRSVSQLLGAKVDYNAKAKTAEISMNDRTVQFQMGSRTVMTNGSGVQMDTAPALVQNSLYIPVSVLAGQLGVDGNYDAENHLYKLAGDDLMQTDMIKLTLEDLEHGAWTAPPRPIVSNDAFMPVSYTFDSADKSFEVRAKNITGADVPAGGEDVALYLLTKDSVQFPKPSRNRPAVSKDGFVIETAVSGSLNEVELVLVKGRLLQTATP